MSTAVATTGQSKVEIFVGEVLPPDRLDTILDQLPAHVKPERFQRNLMIAVTQHPKLLECLPGAVFNEVSKAAALGLYLDPQLGEAYLITGWDSRNNRLVPQLRLGYRGLIKLARQSGQISSVYAHEVCQNDHLEISLGSEKKIVHKPDYFKDRGQVGLYYAVVQFTDGTTDFEPMSIMDIYRIRDRSDGWKAFKAGKIKSTPWASDEGEMSRKTVLRRLLKRLPQSPELADALRIEDADYTDGPDLPPRPSLSSRLSSVPRSLPAPQGFSREHVDAETGEISDTEAQRADVAGQSPGVSSESAPTGDEPGASEEASYPDAGAAAASPPVDDHRPPHLSSDESQAVASEPKATSQNASSLCAKYGETLFRATQAKSLKAIVDQFWNANEYPFDDDHTKARIDKIHGIHATRIKREISDKEAMERIKEVVTGD